MKQLYIYNFELDPADGANCIVHDARYSDHELSPGVFLMLFFNKLFRSLTFHDKLY